MKDTHIAILFLAVLVVALVVRLIYVEKFTNDSTIQMTGDSINFGRRWSIKAEGEYLVVRDNLSGGDKRYAFAPGQNKNL